MLNKNVNVKEKEMNLTLTFCLDFQPDFNVESLKKYIEGGELIHEIGI